MGGGQDLDERPIRGVRTVPALRSWAAWWSMRCSAAQPRGHGAVVAA